MIIQKETRLIDLTVEQLAQIIADSVMHSAPTEIHEDATLNVEQACKYLGDMPKPTLYFKCSKGDTQHSRNAALGYGLGAQYSRNTALG